MKKTITILLLLLLCACTNKKPTLSDIEKKYINLKEDVKIRTTSFESYLKNDYLNALSDLDISLTKLSKNDSSENIIILDKIIQLIHQMYVVSMEYDEDISALISNLDSLASNLVKITFEGSNEQFVNIKSDMSSISNELKQASDKDWSKVEKKHMASFSGVTYNEVENNALNELIDIYDLRDYELIDLTAFIIDNYECIRYGVSDFYEDRAEEIYAVATKLEAYVKNLEIDEAIQVCNFAVSAKTYVKSRYAKTIDDTLFIEDVEIAKKWPQSIFNTIVTELKAQ